MVEGHGAAHRAVPAFGGGDAQGSLGAQNHRVAGGIQVHSPGDAEVQNDVALQTHKGGGEVIHIEAGGIGGIVVEGIGAEIGRDIAAGG